MKDKKTIDNNNLQLEIEKLKQENQKLKQSLNKEELDVGYDSLTGLYDFRSFVKIANDYLSIGKPNEFVMLCIDLDHFKEINERFGYHEGDRLLSYIGGVLKHVCDEEIKHIACRVGSDSFYILFESSENTKLIEAYIENEFDLFDEDIKVRFHRGAYLIENPMIYAQQAMDHAATAMKRAKREGDYKLTWFDSSLHQKSLREQIIIDNADLAFENHEFVPYFQPQVYVGSNGEDKVFRVEILCRWFRDGEIFSTPNEFIPVFEKAAIILRLDQYMLEEACKYIRDYIKQYGNDDIKIAINISRFSILNENCYEFGKSVIESYKIPLKTIEIEITETVAVSTYDRLKSFAKKLIAHGITLSIDDFGSLYSSLDMLEKLEFSVLKLDRKFFYKVSDPKKRNVIIGNMISLCHDLGIEVVAEGVEDEETASLLRSLDCDYIQGYFFAKPMPKSEISSFIGFNPIRSGILKKYLDIELQKFNPFYRHNNFNISSSEYEELLQTAKIGVWSLVLEEGEPARLYGSSVMEHLVGVDHGTDPAVAQKVFEKGIEPEYLPAFQKYLDNIIKNGKDEILYRWHYPCGTTLTIRCVGILDNKYSGNGYRLCGYHQDVTQVELENALKKEKEANYIIQALASSFYVAYYMDLHEGTYREINTADYLKENISKTGNIKQTFSYWIDNILSAEFRDNLRKFVDMSTLEDRLRGRKEVFTDYINAEGLWTRGYIRAVDYDNDGHLYHAFYCARIIQREKQNELELEKSNKEMIEKSEIVEALAKISYNAYLLDIEQDTFKIIKQQKQVYKYIYEGLGLVHMVNILLQTLDEESREKLSSLVADQEKIRKFLSNRDVAELEYKSIFGVWNKAYMVVISRTPKGEVDRLLWMMVDTDAYHKKEDETDKQLQIAEAERNLDIQTGLLNRGTTEKRIKQLLEKNPNKLYAFIMIDLDGLKIINDKNGHAQGDLAINIVCESMKKNFRNVDILGRFGGDEFVAFIEDAPSKVALSDRIASLLKDIKTSKASKANGKPFTCSVGITYNTDGEGDFNNIYKRADLALYASKNNGRNTFTFYDDYVKDKKFN